LSRYWLTPPALYELLDEEFGFDFDPCPFPRNEFNGLIVPWGSVNYVNPPFCKKDAPFGGPSAFARKAIWEQRLGKTSVIILPAPNSIGLLLQAGAELRNGGYVRWLDAETKEPCPVARPQVIAVLRGNVE
jgi:hypothetical protein